MSEAALAAFEAKKAGLLDAIKMQRRKGKDTQEAEQQLRTLVAEAPRPVLSPRLLYSDATPEALTFSLANGWPSAAVLSAEAGTVFGSHGMGQEAILRNLSLLNMLWDGGTIAIDRRSKSSFRLRGRRLTFGLMVQPEALRGFLERAGTLPCGTGFLARFLVAWPESTQGRRHYKEAPAVLPAVERFSRRIRTLLDEPIRTDEQGHSRPRVSHWRQRPRRSGSTFMTASKTSCMQPENSRISAMSPPRLRRTSRDWRHSFMCSKADRVVPWTSSRSWRPRRS